MRRRTLVTAPLLLIVSAVASACPLCIGTAARSSAQDLEELSRAVLAVPQGRQYRVVALVKGSRADSLLDEVLVREPAPGGQALLLVRDDSWPMWVSLGPIGAQHAPLLRVLASGRPMETDGAAWQRRLESAIPHLEGREPLLAEIAYAQCAAAPYAAMRAARAQLNARALRAWVNDPALAARQSLYILLLGFAGDARDAGLIEAQLGNPWRTRQSAHLSSLIAADLELRGVSQVAWVEDRFLRNPSRSTAEIQAALLALSVQAHSDGPIPRQRVIDAYRVFMQAHEDMAGFVAQDLAAWGHWEATPEFAAILASNVRQHDDSRAAIVAYLKQSPRRGSD
jgi:hypothetical protein